MAMGRAVLMTANGFMNIEQAGFGRRIAPGDVDGWREALREFTTDRHKADEMGRQARRVCAEEFSLPAYSSRVAAALRSAAEESPYRRGER
jgi:glycosyltransferase involved in cell wall biosynthesis